jgi:hypothetical protein
VPKSAAATARDENRERMDLTFAGVRGHSP